jgi:ectoine hydroxylase-related dioxygenase (phytanoyl-CoA dioxygenase family)
VLGNPIPADLLGELRDSSVFREDTAGLQDRMAADGYILVREAVPAPLVLAAREEALSRLVEVDEIAEPATRGLFTGRSRRRELVPDLGAFWKSVSEGAALRRVTHGPELRALVSLLLGEPARPHDYLFLRVATPGKATGLHYDMPFFCRGSQRVHTAWIALGEVTLDHGPLMVLEGSQSFEDLIAPIRRVDYDSVGSPRVAAQEDAITLARQRGSRLLTTHFQPGDVVVFGMTLMHGSLDHHAGDNRVRLSCDIRFQPEADPTDPRYFGPSPTGTTGAGYGELNGAKPLVDSWHVR